jgi:hypothetical protein
MAWSLIRVQSGLPQPTAADGVHSAYDREAVTGMSLDKGVELDSSRQKA